MVVVVVLVVFFTSDHDSTSLKTPQLPSSRRLVHAIREFGFARSLLRLTIIISMSSNNSGSRD